ncbi:nitroreductase/quinone reductase family protein [Streptomyces sp. PSRA5]|uniref:nitroreductase/quinone reductase family protein n=1 Tax=Streptomyces panacea TaxID=3035064 RepID=UPI00339C4558
MPTSFANGGNTLLLTTTGAKSGTARTTALGYVRRGDSLLVVASLAGASLAGVSDLGAPDLDASDHGVSDPDASDHGVSDPDAPDHPDWYRDLLAHPVVDVEIGTRTFQALAVPAEGGARDELLVALEPAVTEGPREVTTLADKILDVHDQLRAQLGLVTADVEAHFAALAAHEGPGEPPAPGLGFQIRQRCLAFCQSLDFHHTSEDGHLFPGIARYHPHLTDVFDRLRAEHRTVARIQDGLVALLADLGVAEPPRFRAELAEMTRELNAHLDYEEEVILPLVAEVPWPPAPPPAAG